MSGLFSRIPLLICLPLWAALSGCVSQRLPSIAHVHVGHVISGWPDTPGKRGLFDNAQQDARIAAEHAGYAVEGARNLPSVRMHLGHVMNVFDPVEEPVGPGSGYGLQRALGGMADHLGYAVEVPDATPTLQAALRPLIADLRQEQVEMRLLAGMARTARIQRSAAHVVAYAQEIRQRCDALAARLDQWRGRLDAALTAEQPPYRTVAEQYLFGLIRLPSGEWAFDPQLDPSRYGYY